MIGVWSEILESFSLFCNQNLEEPAFVLYKMATEDAFIFVKRSSQAGILAPMEHNINIGENQK